MTVHFPFAMSQGCHDSIVRESLRTGWSEQALLARWVESGMLNADRLPPQEGERATVDGDYRYHLARVVSDGCGKGTVLFLMLNPSTADAEQDDPTIRRCIGFAERWGFARLEVVNLFAFRASNPKDLIAARNPFGPDNDYYLQRACGRADTIVAAWGACAGAEEMVTRRVKHLFRFAYGLEMFCLGFTKGGHPRHPLYVRGDAPLQKFPTPVFVPPTGLCPCPGPLKQQGGTDDPEGPPAEDRGSI